MRMKIKSLPHQGPQVCTSRECIDYIFIALDLSGEDAAISEINFFSAVFTFFESREDSATRDGTVKGDESRDSEIGRRLISELISIPSLSVRESCARALLFRDLKMAAARLSDRIENHERRIND